MNFMQETSVVSSYTVYQEPIKYFFFKNPGSAVNFKYPIMEKAVI